MVSILRLDLVAGLARLEGKRRFFELRHRLAARHPIRHGATIGGRPGVLGILLRQRGEIRSAPDLFQQILGSGLDLRLFRGRLAIGLQQNVPHLDALRRAERVQVLAVHAAEIGVPGNHGLLHLRRVRNQDGQVLRLGRLVARVVGLVEGPHVLRRRLHFRLVLVVGELDVLDLDLLALLPVRLFDLERRNDGSFNGYFS